MEDKRRCLSKLIASGKENHYLGTKKIVLDKLNEEEIDTLYERYETVKREEIAKSLTDTVLSAIGAIGCKVLDIKNMEEVITDLKEDKFTGKLIEEVAVYAFDKFGYYLAPVTITSTLIKHKYREMKNKPTDEDDDNLKSKVEGITENVINNLE